MSKSNRLPRFHSIRICLTAVLLLCLLISVLPARGERSVDLSPLHYGQDALRLHLDNQPNTVTLDGVTYTFEDDNVFSFKENLTVYGGKTRSVYEMTLPKNVWSETDANDELLLGTVTINPQTKVTLFVGDGNRITGAYTFGDPVDVTDVYRENILLPRDAEGNPYLVDRIFLYSYSFGDEEIHHAASVYFDYEDYAAGHMPGDATALPEKETSAPVTEAPVTESPTAETAAQPALSPIVPIAAVLVLALLAIILLKSRKKPTVTSASSEKPMEKTATGPDSLPIPENEDLARLARRFENLTLKIKTCVNEHPEKNNQVRKFFSYYVPTAHRLLEYAVNCERAGVSGAELEKSRATCRHGLEMACTAAQKHLDAMFSNEGLDADADIVVMERMLKVDGFDSKAEQNPFGKSNGTGS